MNKKLYTRNYEIRHIPLPNGAEREEVVYKGEYYCLSWSPRQKKTTRLVSSALIALSYAVFAAAGFLNNAGSRQYYVLLPFLCTSFPLIFEGFAIFRLWFSSDKMPIDVFHNSLLRLRKSSAAAAIFSGLGTVGEMVFLIINTANCALDELLMLMAAATICLDNLAVFFIIHRVAYRVVPNKNESN